MISTNKANRREILRGIGLSIGLPWMESLASAAEVSPDTGIDSPRRMAFLFVPNGVHLPDWTPQRSGYGYDLPHILQPLSKVQEDVLVISGLTHDKGRANGDGPGDPREECISLLDGLPAT